MRKAVRQVVQPNREYEQSVGDFVGDEGENVQGPLCQPRDNPQVQVCSHVKYAEGNHDRFLSCVGPGSDWRHQDVEYPHDGAVHIVGEVAVRRCQQLAPGLANVQARHGG